MKRLINILTILVATLTYGQTKNAANNENNVLSPLTAYRSDGAIVGGATIIINSEKSIDGSVYLFKGWNNSGVIETQKGSYEINNINFNVKRNSFESQIPNTDSIFTFDFTNIEKMFVDNQVFKKVYSPKEGVYKIYQVVAEAENFAIYKDNYVIIKEGDPNPLKGRSNDKYFLRGDYFIKLGASFKKIRFKKSSILKALGKKAGKVEDFAKRNQLSFKNEQDLQKIADFYASL